MRERKFEKSHIHILESETLSRESRVTKSLQEFDDSNPYIVHYCFYPQLFATHTLKKFPTGKGFPLFSHKKLEEKKEEGRR